MAALHARAVTHRDLKPANTLIQLAATATRAAESEPRSTAEAPRHRAAASTRRPSVGFVERRRSHAAGGGRTSRPWRSPLEPAQAGGRRAALAVAAVGASRRPALRSTRVCSKAWGSTRGGADDGGGDGGYQPPEVSLGTEPFDAARPSSYDLWSLGVTILELLLGTPHVLQLSSRAEARLRLKFADQPPAVVSRLLLAHALAEHCILPAEPQPPAESQPPAAGKAPAAAHIGRRRPRPQRAAEAARRMAPARAW